MPPVAVLTLSSFTHSLSINRTRAALLPKLQLLYTWIRLIRAIKLIFSLDLKLTYPKIEWVRRPTLLVSPSEPRSSIMEDTVTATKDDCAFPLYPTPMGKRRALLIACTYADSPDKEMHLQNSWKDIESLKQLLMKNGWKEDEMVVLVDRGPNRDRYPTMANILKEMRALVDGAGAGDFLFMHFSGHGGQTKATVDKYERDGKDELIWPCDYHALDGKGGNCIIDDTFREILVDELPIGCKLLGLIDCCSSGTMFDLPNEDSFADPEVPIFKSAQPLPSSCLQKRFRDPRRTSTLPPTPTCQPIVVRARKAQSRKNTVEHLGGTPTTFSRFLPRRISERGANESQRDDISEHNAETAKKDLLDTRIILGDVMCISSCPDSAQAYETEDGGTLVQAFCKVMDLHNVGSDSSLTLGRLYESLRYNLREEHEKARPLHPNIGAKAPVPQMTFSRLFVDKEAVFRLRR